MGVIKGSFLFILSVLLFILLLVTGSFLTLSSSLKYENVQKEITPLIDNFVNECDGQENYTFTFEGNEISVPCSYIKENNISLKGAVDTAAQDAYYKDYNCDFWDCFATESTPFFLVSEKAKDYWKEKFYYALLASLVILVLIFFLFENKLNFPVLTGSLFIVSSLLILKAKSIATGFIPESFRTFSSFLNIFFSEVLTVFWIFFILGLLLVGLGLGLKFSNLDFVKKITEKSENTKLELKKTKKRAQISINSKRATK